MTGLKLAQCGDFPGMRDDVEHETAGPVGLVRHFVDCKRNAIDRDRALGRDIGREFLGRRDPELDRAAGILPADNPANGIDMAGDDMPAQLVTQLERLFKVELAPGSPLVLRRAADRFARDIDREPGIAGFAAALDHGQADARTGDRGADRYPGRIIGAGNDDAQVALLANFADRADGGDYSGKHHLRS